MRIFFAILIAISLVGCDSRGQKKKPVGALTGLYEFEIAPFFSPFSNINQEQLFEVLVNSFREVGEVKIKETLENSPESSATYLLVAIGESGSIQAFANTKVEANGFKTASTIWQANSENQNDLPYPEIVGNAVAFKKRDPLRDEKISSQDVMKGLISKFAQEYALDNSPVRKKPIFYIHQPVLQKISSG